MSTSVMIVGVEEVVEAVDTVVRAVGDIVIVSVGVIEAMVKLWLRKML